MLFGVIFCRDVLYFTVLVFYFTTPSPFLLFSILFSFHYPTILPQNKRLPCQTFQRRHRVYRYIWKYIGRESTTISTCPSRFPAVFQWREWKTRTRVSLAVVRYQTINIVLESYRTALVLNPTNKWIALSSCLYFIRISFLEPFRQSRIEATGLFKLFPILKQLLAFRYFDQFSMKECRN